MKQYRLLRNNRESGPYTAAQLIETGLKAYDLLWEEGKSAAWRYPSEMEAFKAYAPVIEEQPYDRFYKRKTITAPAVQPVTTFAAAETYVGTTQNPAARGNIGPFTVRQSTLAPIGTKMASALQATLAKPAFGSRAIPLVPDFNSVNGPAISPQAQLWIKELTPTTGQRQSTSIVLLGNKASKVKVRDAESRAWREGLIPGAM